MDSDFLHPIGRLNVLGAVDMASTTSHWGKPIWVSSGGAELPLTNMAVVTTLLFAGAGKFSLDELVGTQLPRWIVAPGLAAVAAGVYWGNRDPVPRLTAVISSATKPQRKPVAQVS